MASPSAVAPPPTASIRVTAQLLRERGLRVTAQRLAAFDAIAAGEHLPAEEVAVRVRGALGPTSTQTVYDALAALLGVGLLRRIEPADSPMLYERRVGDNHHHLICRACRRVQDVDCLVGAKPCLTPDDDHGYILDEAEVTFWGLCPSCQAAAAARPTP